ncbi:MAG: glycosyltransferase family 39 protein [Patescibacteria group bacterium]
MKKITNIIFFSILVLAFFLRFYKLDTYPALNADEAALGYNAYSLIQTGKDEHGNSWPIHFQSFNDYKPGLYVYTLLPFVKFFGLTELAVRLPGALAGVLTVGLVYIVIKNLFLNMAAKTKEIFALTSSLFLAISPWHIHFSRGGWEVNFATFLIVWGFLLLVKSINRGFTLKPLIVSVIVFVASLYTYHAARIIVPVLVLGILAINYKQTIRHYKHLAISGLVGLLMVAPLVYDFTRPAISSRAAGVGLFADTGPKARLEEQRSEHVNFSSAFAKIFHNKLINYGLVFFENWSEHYWGEFLFLSGDEIQRNRVPETGQMYTIELLFIGIAVVSILRLKDKHLQREWLIVSWWLIIAPVAAALTFQSPHALRSQNMVIPLTFFSAYGFTVLVETIKQLVKTKQVKITLYGLMTLVIVLSFARYVHMYYSHMAKEYPFSSQYGVKELVNYVLENKQRYEKVLITDRYDQPYILFLFYSKYDPVKFQAEHFLTGRDNFGFSTVNHFDKYYFTSIKFDEAKPQNPNSMLVGTQEEIPEEANIVKNVYGSNNHLYFQIVAN